jgi:hypothetical protein
MLPDGSLGLLYERAGIENSMWITRYVCFAKFNLEWLEASSNQTAM